MIVSLAIIVVLIMVICYAILFFIKKTNGGSRMNVANSIITDVAVNVINAISTQEMKKKFIMANSNGSNMCSGVKNGDIINMPISNVDEKSSGIASLVPKIHDNVYLNYDSSISIAGGNNNIGKINSTFTGNDPSKQNLPWDDLSGGQCVNEDDIYKNIYDVKPTIVIY